MVEDTVIPFLKSKEIDTFEYGTDHKKLDEMMKNIFNSKVIEYEKQKVFSYYGNVDNIGVDTLEEYRMNRLAAYLASRTIQETLRLNHRPI